MRLCAGLPCTLCLSTLTWLEHAPLRRSPLHSVPLNPDVKPNAPLRRSPLHPVPLNPDVTRTCASAPVNPAPRASSSTTTDMRLCAGQPCTSCLILNNNRYAPLRRSTLHLVPHPQQQPICAPAPVNPAPRASSSTTTDMRLCAGQPCTSCLILNNNRYAPLRRSTLPLVARPCTIQSNINPSINPLPGRGRWGSDSEAERGSMAWR